MKDITFFLLCLTLKIQGELWDLRYAKHVSRDRASSPVPFVVVFGTILFVAASIVTAAFFEA